MNAYAALSQYFTPLEDFDGPPMFHQPLLITLAGAVLFILIAVLLFRVLQLADRAGDPWPAIRICVCLTLLAMAWLFRFSIPQGTEIHRRQPPAAKFHRVEFPTKPSLPALAPPLQTH